MKPEEAIKMLTGKPPKPLPPGSSGYLANPETRFTTDRETWLAQLNKRKMNAKKIEISDDLVEEDTREQINSLVRYLVTRDFIEHWYSPPVQMRLASNETTLEEEANAFYSGVNAALRATQVDADLLEYEPLELQEMNLGLSCY
jgi:hypothetical protein